VANKLTYGKIYVKVQSDAVFVISTPAKWVFIITFATKEKNGFKERNAYGIKHLSPTELGLR